MFKLKPDYELAQKRINAFWDNAETDRPVVFMTFPKAKQTPFTWKQHATRKDYWLDLEYRTEEIAHWAENTVFYAESMPVYIPNLGPEIVSIWAGCPYHFGEETVWTEPCVFDWEKDNAVIDMAHPMFKTLDRFTRLLIEKSNGDFIVGLTDYHPGADHLCAIRDAEKLAMDLLDCPDIIKAKLAASYKEYYPTYDYFVNMLKDAGMPLATWLPMTSETSMYVPSNDFSYMISADMFNEFFLDGIIEECRHYKQNIYHLDGIAALRHLDSLLAIPELHAIQWVPGEGNEQVYPWLDVFKKILAAGKSVMAYPQNMDELRFLMDNLPARGLCLHMWFVDNESDARDLMKLIEKWPNKG